VRTDALDRPQRPIELSADPHFAPRVKRLAAVSLVALGLIWALASATLHAPVALNAALAAGWVLMPTTLIASLAEPRLRYALVVPASLVGFGLLAVSLWWLPADPVAAGGWLLMTAGVLLGGVLGIWFWLRLLPVPRALDNPFSSGRWAQIWEHVALIVLGLALVGIGLALA
jgi:hypothetical protein